MRTWQMICLLACLAGIASFAIAQPGAPGEHPPWRGGRPAPSLFENWQERDVRELVETVMLVRLSKELELDDEKTVLLVRRFGEAKEQAESLAKERAQALDELKAGIRAGDADEVIQGKLTKLRDLDKQLATIKEDAFQKAAPELTVTQQAKLYVFIQDFEDQMRRIIMKARERYRGMTGGPPFMMDGQPQRGRLGPEGELGPGRREFVPGRGEFGPGRGRGEFGPGRGAPGPGRGGQRRPAGGGPGFGRQEDAPKKSAPTDAGADAEQ